MNIHWFVIVFAFLLFINPVVLPVLGETETNNDSEIDSTKPFPATTTKDGEEDDRRAEEKIRATSEDAEGTAALFAAAQKVEDAYRSGDITKIRQLMTETAQQTLGAQLDSVSPEMLRRYADDFKTRRVYFKTERYAEISFWNKDGQRFTSAFSRNGPNNWEQMR